MNIDIGKNKMTGQGQLVKLRSGQYFIVPGANRPAVGRPAVSLLEETNAVLLDKQGKQCWHALVDGQVLLVWDHNFVEKPVE